ncbi:MAG: aminotransferase class I/II-fold pyridoxal phosphate-dependent enzyme, partial [Candidatus Aminicenantes bacterium]|nr:aminotransferase class I/II-fold pyridoxal phosphate-dependent enzyme [Candidatus Aminicenantes bacterium]
MTSVSTSFHHVPVPFFRLLHYSLTGWIQQILCQNNLGEGLRSIEIIYRDSGQVFVFEDGFRPDLDKLKALIKPETKLISLTHPNNPTGSMMTKQELQEVIRLVEEKDIFLLFDETYRHMASGFSLLPAAASLSEKAISISSMSKCYGLPGIRIGWLATKNPEVLAEVVAIREQVSIANNALSE